MSDWTTVPLNHFGGYNPTSSPDESACTDILNIDFGVRGAIRTRDGYDNFTPAATERYAYLFPFVRSNGTKQLLLGRTSSVNVLDSAGASVTTGAPSNAWSMVRFGSPVAEYVYIASNALTGTAATDQIRRWDGTAFSAPAGLGSATLYYQYLALQSPDNRLVGACLKGSPYSPSQVGFSNAGAAETWTSTDTVQITPGDGESIQGMCSWRDLLIVWKNTKFAVFHGNSTDATGGAVFNYRVVEGQGASPSVATTTMRMPFWAVAPEGVYFYNRHGIWFTTGGPAVRISQPLDAYFADLPQAYLHLGQMCWHNDRLYLTITESGTTNNRVIVWDRPTNTWSIWDLEASSMCPSPFTENELVFIGTASTDSEYVYKFGPSYTTDDGTAIAWRHKSGFYDLGVEGEKRARQMTVWGTGSVDLKMARDFGDLDTARSMTLGTSPAIDRATTNCGKDGTVFAHQFSGSGPTTIYRSALEMMPNRATGSKSP